MNLLEDSKMSLLDFNFFMIYKMLVLLKYHLKYLKDNTFECFFNSSFFTIYDDGKVVLMKKT